MKSKRFRIATQTQTYKLTAKSFSEALAKFSAQHSDIAEAWVSIETY